MGKDAELLSHYGSLGCWCCGREFRERIFLRDFKIEGEKEPRNWCRLAILPNLEGQKYTLGTRYTDRERDGEFIFLPGPAHDSSKDLKTTAVSCTIVVDKDKYFVKPINGGLKIYRNGVKVLRSTELKFGDRLGIGNKKPGNRFLFKERELNPGEFIYTTSFVRMMHTKLMEEAKNGGPKSVEEFAGEFSPGSNTLILSRILSHLSIEELKHVRLVARIWSEEAFKVLQKRCTLSLDLSRGYDQTRDSMAFFRYSVEMRNSPLMNWRIALPPIGVPKAEDAQVEKDEDAQKVDAQEDEDFEEETKDSDEEEEEADEEDSDKLDPSPGKPGAKLMDDLNFFIFHNPGQPHLIKRLELGGKILSKFDYDLHIRLLQVLGHQLEELTWGGEWNLNKIPGKELTFPENMGWNKLRAFTLTIILLQEYEDQDAYDPADSTWMAQLINSIRSVTTLGLECSRPISLTFLNLLQTDGKLSNFSKLDEMRVHQLDGKVVRALLKLNKPLQKLGLHQFDDMWKKGLHSLDALLAKHSQTLESLELHPPGHRLTRERVPCPSRLLINFPSFPKLLSLRIVSQHEHDVRIAFPDGRINYAKDFPSLASLSLQPHGGGWWRFKRPDTPSTAWTMARGIYETWFPPIEPSYLGEIQVCRTLRCLEVRHQISVGMEGEKIPMFPPAAELIVAEMFPNVVDNSWLDSVRKGKSNTIKAIGSNAEGSKESGNKAETPTLGRLRSSTRTLRSGSKH